MRACRRGREPAAAEGIQALAVRVAGVAVVLEEVERMAVVGDLPHSVRAGARGDERDLCPATAGWLPGSSERGPVDGTGAVALAHRSVVPVAQIERAPLP